MKYVWLSGILCLLFVFSHSPALGNNVDLERYFQSKIMEISQFWSEGKIKEGTAILEELYSNDELLKINDNRITITYSLACGYSLLGRRDKALDLLSEAIDAGFSNYTHIQKDGDLDNIRNDDRFSEIIRRIQARLEFWDSPFISTPYSDNLGYDEKVAGLSKLWSEIKYNFVYFDRVPEINWDSLYMAYLPRVKTTQSTYEYYRMLQEICAHLKDGHTGINPPAELMNEFWAKPPIQTLLIEDKVLITNVDNDSLFQNGIIPGLEITQINGIPVRQYVTERSMKYICASTKQGIVRNAYGFYLLAGSVNEPVELVLKGKNGKIFKETLNREPFIYSPPKFDFNVINGNIGYVNLPTFGSNDIYDAFDSTFNRIMQTDALIIDLRENGGGNSQVGYNILAYLTDSPFPIVQSKAITYSGYKRAHGLVEKWEVSSEKWQSDESKYYDKPVIVLIGSFTASAAEDLVVSFDTMRRGKLIGEPTAGTTGQPLSFSLPGGGSGRVCTMRCTYPDGKEFVGSGINPHIPVKPTAGDIKSNLDVVLETAVKYLKKSPDNHE